jgi:glutamyl-Q tRNA(Asp) synthetase
MQITRFAPSPTGYLHLGHARSALFARACGDRFLLRIEDIDTERCRPGFTDAIFEDLAWLGLSWERPVRYQSRALADYAAARSHLEALGVVYPCTCSRRDIAQAASAPQGAGELVYPGLCRGRPLVAGGEPAALRLDIGAALALTGPLTWVDRDLGMMAADPAVLGDPVLARRDGTVSYHLAVTVDDALQGVTLVTRGRDLIAATSIHRLLQALLGLPVPVWHHHELLTDAQGRRLSKRDGALGLRAMRAAGMTAAAVCRLALEAGVRAG